MEEFIGQTIANKYQIISIIGQGSFGHIVLARNTDTKEYVAVKMEEGKTKNPQLLWEGKMLSALQVNHGNPPRGIPKLHEPIGQDSQFGFNYMILDLLGPSLEDLFQLCKQQFSLKTVLMLADQMLQRIEYLHQKNYIHRDIKPENFLMGLGKNSHIVYIIDYGLSKKYKDAKTQQHIPYRENKNLTGTARYASINAHLGIEQSRRDDLEALGYIFVYFAKQKLNWQGMKANNKQEKYTKIMQKKMQIPVEILCKGLPVEFSIYLNYCKSLRFEDKPDYMYLRKMFKDLFIKSGYEWDYIYDWCSEIEGSQQQKHYNGKITIETNVSKENLTKIGDASNDNNQGENLLQSNYNEEIDLTKSNQNGDKNTIEVPQNNNNNNSNTNQDNSNKKADDTGSNEAQVDNQANKPGNTIFE